jgi:hypothetical protein
VSKQSAVATPVHDKQLAQRNLPRLQINPLFCRSDPGLGTIRYDTIDPPLVALVLQRRIGNNFQTDDGLSCPNIVPRPPPKKSHPDPHSGMKSCGKGMVVVAK